MRRLWLASLAVAALIAAIPSGASAATTIGETFDPSQQCSAGITWLQSTSPAGQYSAQSDGVITRWNFQAGPTPPQLKFKVGRSAGGDDFTIVGESAVVIPVTDTLNSFFTRIPVQAGDVIGFFTTTNGACRGVQSGYGYHTRSEDVASGTTEDFDPFAGIQLDVSALLEPDCDRDGLGDETQDSNLPTPPCPTTLTCKGQTATHVGTDGPDEIAGTDGRDVVVALRGRDEVSGLRGKDLICGGSGRDTLKGGKGKDKLYGQKGKDKLRGGGGKDRCVGGKKDDSAKKCEVEKSI